MIALKEYDEMTRRRRFRINVVLATALAASLAAYGCGTDATAPDPDDEPQYGSARFNISIPQRLAAAIERMQVLVTAADIDTLRTDLTMTGDSSAHGIVDPIPVGTNRKVTVNAYDETPMLTHTGSADGLTVAAGDTLQVQITLSAVTGAIEVTVGFGSSTPALYLVERIADLPVGVEYQPQARELLDGRIIVFGGLFQDPDPRGFNQVQIYDVATDSWELVDAPTLPYGIWQSGAAMGSNGNLYLTPGMGPNASNGWGHNRRMIEYDPTTGSFTEKADLIDTNIWDAAICRGGDGELYTFGGWTGSARGEVFHYDPVNDAVTQVTSLQGGNRTAIRCVTGSNGNIYLFGGGNWGSYEEVIEVFDIATQETTVSATSLANPEPAHVTAWSDDNGLIYILPSDNSGYLYAFDESTHDLSVVDSGYDIPWRASPTVDPLTGTVYLVGGFEEEYAQNWGSYSEKCFRLTPRGSP